MTCPFRCHQIGFVALFFSFMANRNRQLGYV